MRSKFKAAVKEEEDEEGAEAEEADETEVEEDERAWRIFNSTARDRPARAGVVYREMPLPAMHAWSAIEVEMELTPPPLFLQMPMYN